MPDEGYNMGSEIRVRFNKLVEYDDRTSEYSHSCKYSAKHGGYTLKLTKEELKNIKVIANLVTYIYPNQRSKVKKCWWYSGRGNKNNWSLEKVEGYIFHGYHSTNKEKAKEEGLRNLQFEKDKKKKVEKFNKALRLQYSFEDSLMSGNCEAGTKAFIMRLGLDSKKKYRGSFLLKQAKEKSHNSIFYVEKMIKFKVKN